MPQSPEHPIEKPGPEETLEFLKRQEVRTMAKDMAQLREGESKKERERIVSLREMSRRDTKEQTAPAPKEQSPSLMPSSQNAPEKHSWSMPKRPARFDKVFVRVVVLLGLAFLLVNVIAFGVWKARKGAKENISPAPVEQVTTPVPPAPAPTPVSFFEAPQQELLLGNRRELLPELQALLFSPQPLGFLNIVVKTQLGILSAQEFLEKAEITMPLTLREKLTENIMLFSYHQDNKGRLGVVFELKDAEGVSDQLQSWEQTLEQDMKAFFDIIGGKGSAYTPFFRSSTYQGIPIRFQTFSVIDFGIVYGVVQDYLLLTSSLGSIQEAVDLLLANQ